MPRLTERYRNARRQQVVDAARRCFARSGFQATSMQDIFTESGLSAGAVYGYFSSKEELVGAIVEEVLAEITTGFDAVLSRHELPPLSEVVGHVLGVLDKQQSRRGFAMLAIQVWAEALRNPALGSVLSARYQALRRKFARLVKRYQQEGLIDPAPKADDIARVLTSLGPGFLVQQALIDGADARTYSRGLAALFPAVHPA